jgi:hypothetical protein
MYDIFFVGKINDEFHKLKIKFPLAKQVNTFYEAKDQSLTKMFWVVWDDVKLESNFMFDYKAPLWDSQYIHVFKNGDYYDGVCLIPRTSTISEREIKHRFFINKKEIPIRASTPRVYDIFQIETYDDYISAVENSSTDMFWMHSRNLEIHDTFKFDIYFSHHNLDDRNQNHAYINRVGDKDSYNGIFLCSKLKLLSKREVEHRFPINRREWPIVATIPNSYKNYSGLITNYEEYKEILDRSVTELFWLIPNDVTVDPNFKFDIYFTHDNEYDRKINHVFLNGEHYDGVMLLSKHSPISEREFKYRFLTNKKSWNIVASTPKNYDIFYIDSWEEYQEALQRSSTDMFWMSSRNISAAPDFKFDTSFCHHDTYDRGQNHAFIHRVGDKDSYNGIFLCSKLKPLSKREVEYRTLLERKEWDIVASGPISYQQYVVN